MRKEDCYFLGFITRRHGLKGNLILKLDTDQPEFYQKMESIFVEINGLLVPFFIENKAWNRADSFIMTLKNVSETIVDQLVGKEVFLPLQTLPPLSGKQFYYHEVIGFEVTETNGNTCGIIKSVNDNAAQHYFILRLFDKEVIIPVIKDWIIEVKREEKTIVMQLPDGLMDVFLHPSKED